MTDRKKLGLYWTLFALWAGVIFYFSAQPDTVSSQQSGVFTQLLEEAVAFISGPSANVGMLYATLDHLVRKAAHFTVYLVLGVLAQRAYWHSGAKRRGLCVTLSLLTCALYAATDELHQYFVPGRAMMLTDVALDSAGALCGAAASVFVLDGKSRKGGRHKG